MFIRFDYCRAFVNWALPSEHPEKSGKILASWDAEKMVKRLVSAGAEQLVIDARSQWSAHYPTSVFKQAEILEGRDIIRELLDAAGAHGVNIVAYLPPGEAGMVTVEHPEWAARNIHGKPLRFADTDFYRACINTPYREFEIECQKELVSKYPELAGVWYDGPGYASDCRDEEGNLYCYCDCCREKFRREVGYAMPENPEWNTIQRADMVKWRIQCSREVVREYYKAVKSVCPEMTVTANVAWTGWRGPGEEICRWLDQVSMEMGFYNSPFILSVAKAVAEGKPVEAYTHLNVRAGHACRGFQAGLPEAEARYRAHLVLTYGAVPVFTWGNEETAASVFEDIRERAEACNDTLPLKWCGLVYSQMNQYLHDPTVWRHYGKFEASGCFDLLADEHLPTSIIPDSVLHGSDLDQYKVIVLPDTAVIDENTAARLRAFVENGGGLVATGYTSLRNAEGIQQEAFILEDLLGVKYAGGVINRVQDVSSGYELPVNDSLLQTIKCTMHEHRLSSDKLLQSAMMSGLAENPPCPPVKSLSYFGIPVPVERLDGTEVIASSDNGPLVTVKEAGKGKVAFIASDFGTSYRNDPVLWMHAFWGALVRYVAGSPVPIDIEAPSWCKTTFFRRQNLLFIHFLADPYPFGRWPNVLGNSRIFRESFLPIENVKVRLPRGEFIRAALIPGGRDIPIGEAEGKCCIELPLFRGHTILRLESAKGITV